MNISMLKSVLPQKPWSIGTLLLLRAEGLIITFLYFSWNAGFVFILLAELFGFHKILIVIVIHKESDRIPLTSVINGHGRWPHKLSDNLNLLLRIASCIMKKYGPGFRNDFSAYVCVAMCISVCWCVVLMCCCVLYVSVLACIRVYLLVY